MELKNNMIMKNETKIYIDGVLHYLDIENAKLLNCLRPVIKLGQRYTVAGNGSTEYILATHDVNKCILINLTLGTRWNDGAYVENFNDITKEEFQKITNSGEFTLVK